MRVGRISFKLSLPNSLLRGSSKSLFHLFLNFARSWARNGSKSSLKSPEPKISRSAQAEPNSSPWIPPEGLMVDDFETDVEAEEEPPKAALSTRLRALADEINLVGTARSKELHWRDMTTQQQIECKKAMAAEWSKWTEFSATKTLPAKEMNTLLDRGAKPVGCR